MPHFTSSPLDVAIVGAGQGSLSAAITLRRAGHNVTMYERCDFANEVGASLSSASDGSRFLHKWGVDVASAKPVGEYPLGDYKANIDTHRALLASAFDHHKAIALDTSAGTITFENGTTGTADLIVAAEGIRSLFRGLICITSQFTASTCCCYRSIISATKLRSLGLDAVITNNAIEYWGGFGIHKIVMSPCSVGDVVSTYEFYPAAHNDLRQYGWNISASPQQLADTFPDLDHRARTMFLHAEDIKMCGAVQAIEDAGALGLMFGREGKEKYSFEEAMGLYKGLRKGRATRMQEASAKAREDLNERFGWSSANDRYEKLTIEEVCGYR
ncbi:FAD/NAD(P)-binding domain-containing protein [Saccharata proteae CBS 121410]|uniref:FAD/NAD(P)-binding domain-containing protein n=1 Tax=Saccharata proteae CBS 121410 TaxID=1314787 RepID=A0A9P4HT76_9PEZI|nr:FAD/NAD(P)-binding domain-containing protein [Saccharata proteae CBS 121410]